MTETPRTPALLLGVRPAPGGLAERLLALLGPSVDEQLRHPTVAGIGRGDLDDAVMRSWLEQDHAYLLDYARVFSRLAWQAPAEHLVDLVDLAHGTLHDELALHRELSAPFGADLSGAVEPGPACVAYSSFLLDTAADYGNGLVALLPCLWGYAELGLRLAVDPPAEPRYRRWVDTYADPAFALLAQRAAVVLDEADALGLVPDHDRAERLFVRALDHEHAFWSVP